MRILSCCWKVWRRTAISKFSWCSCRRRSLLGYLQIDSCLNQTVLTLSRCHQDRAQLWSRSIKSAANPSWRQSILLSWLKQIAKMKEEWDKCGSYPGNIFWCRSVRIQRARGSHLFSTHFNSGVAERQQMCTLPLLLTLLLALMRL